MGKGGWSQKLFSALQITGEWGRELASKIFSDFRASVWSKIMGGPAPPGPFPWIRHWNGPGTHVITLFRPHVVCPYYSAPNL